MTNGIQIGIRRRIYWADECEKHPRKLDRILHKLIDFTDNLEDGEEVDIYLTEHSITYNWLGAHAPAVHKTGLEGSAVNE